MMDYEAWANLVAQEISGGAEMAMGTEREGMLPTPTYNPARRSPWSGRPYSSGVSTQFGGWSQGRDGRWSPPFEPSPGWSYWPGATGDTGYARNDTTGAVYSITAKRDRWDRVTWDVSAKPIALGGGGAAGAGGGGAAGAGGGMTEYQLASERRQWAQFNWQQAVNSRDFEAAERWREVTDQWRQREFALATEQYLTGLEKSPTDWAALSFATRGRGAEFPRGAAPPQNIQTLAGAGRNVPDWLRGMYGTLTPEGSTFDQTGSPTGYPAPFLEHLGRIGSSLESPDVGRQWEAWRGKSGFGARPVGAMETPWYKALTGGPGLEAWRPPGGVTMPNLRALAAMSPSESQQAMGAYQGMGVPWADLMAEVQRRIPGGRAPQMRWW